MIHETDQFLSSGKPVRMDKYRPDAGSPHPAVLVIHGASVLTDRSAYMRDIASSLSSHGFATYFVHYFDRTGHEYATDEEMHTHFLTWIDTLRDAITSMVEDPHVNPSGVACFGFSLGGYLAVALGAQDDRVAAVVELAGGVDPEYVKEISRMPPTLILHGDQDARVPVTNAAFLSEVLINLGTQHETYIYPGEPHVLSFGAITDAVKRSASFIHKHLAG